MDFKFACDGDIYLQKEFRNVVKKYNIETIIETGSRTYDTASFFSTLVNKVYTIEICEEAFNKNSGKTKMWGNIIPLLGDTKDLLEGTILKLKSTEHLLIYLDAHSLEQQSNPLLHELNIILKTGIKPIIVIHDFKVPDKDFGYNCYNNGDCLEWDYVKDIIEKIYGENNFNKYYNSKATGSRRGTIFITPRNR